ncbi:MAG: CheY-like chemotaxis protein, partial [Myxococcota bacterium]
MSVWSLLPSQVALPWHAAPHQRIRRPTLRLVDHDMPGLTGTELVDWVRASKIAV